MDSNVLKVSNFPPVPAYPTLRPAPQWVKGQSGNPNGRPAYKDLLDKALPATKRAEILQSLATQGDNLNVSLAATKYIDDRVEGPVPQQVNVAKLTMSIDFTEVQHTLEQLQGHNTLDDTQAIDITSTIPESEE